MVMKTIICSNCGKEIVRELRERDKLYKNHFCCKKCESEFRKGKLINPNCKKYNLYEIREDYAIIKIKNNKYGEFDCLIDIEDINKVSPYFWNIRYDERHPNCTPYVENHKNNKRIHLHRLIMDCPNNMIVDHINHNNLDNRKANLRILNQSKNCLNKVSKRYSYNKRDDYYTVYYNKKTIAKFRNEENAKQYANYINDLVQKGEWEKLNNLRIIKLSEKDYNFA